MCKFIPSRVIIYDRQGLRPRPAHSAKKRGGFGQPADTARNTVNGLYIGGARHKYTMSRESVHHERHFTPTSRPDEKLHQIDTYMYMYPLPLSPVCGRRLYNVAIALHIHVV